MLGTIKSSTEISYLFSHGKRHATPCVTMIVYRGDTQHGPSGRVAFIAGKKNGNAVWRNSAKRRLRAVCHDIGGPWPELNVIFMANRKTTRVEYQKLVSTCKKIMESYLGKYLVLKVWSKISAIPKGVLLLMIKFYRLAISPLLPATCRFIPTCSEYGLVAVQRFGFLKGLYLTCKRILRCRPGGGRGYDPVPDTFHL